MEESVPAAAPLPRVDSVLPGPIALLTQAWGMFTKKWKELFLVALIPFVVVVIAGLVSAGGTAMFTSEIASGSVSPLMVVGIVIAVIVIVYVFILQAVAMLDMAANDRGVRGVWESYKAAQKNFLSYIWVAIIVGLLTLGGFVLFIIPGIFLLVCTIFALYALIIDNERGTVAVGKSWALVEGRWWKVFGRLVVCFLIIYLLFPFVIGLIIGLIGGLVGGGVGEGIIAVLSFFLQYVVLPAFSVLYFVNFYRSLVSTRGAVDSSKRRKLITGLTWGALIVPIIGGTIFLSVVLASLSDARDKALEVQENAQIEQDQFNQMLLNEEYFQ